MAILTTVSHLKRDADYIRSNLQVSNGHIYVKKDTTIHVPKRFSIKGLAILGEENYAIGIFPFIMDGKYGLLNVMSMVHLGASNIEEIVIDEIEYYAFSFEKGSEILQEISVVKDDNITFNVFDELISNGNIPWYLDYLDLAKLYDTSDMYADSKMVHYVHPYSIIVSLLARSPTDRLKLYRYILNDKKDLAIKPDFTQLKSVMYMAKSTVNKIAGAYMDEGVISALVYPSEKVEHIEKLLRA